MKQYSIFFLSIIALIGITACTHDDDVVFVAQEDPEGIEFTNNFSETYTLTSSTGNNLAERFVWNEADFDAPTTVTYELHGSADTEFGDYEVMGSTSDNNLSITIDDLLGLAEDAGLDNDPETESPNTGLVYFRIRAYAGEGEGNALESISEPVSLSLELPEAEEEEEESKREFYLVGDASEAGWDPDNNNTPLFRDAENDNIYYFEGRFAGGGDVEGFKLLEILGEWQPQWGLSDGELSNSDILGDDPDAFAVEDDAYYSLMINVDEMTYTWEEIDESEATVYDSIGLVGDGTEVGWPNDDNPDLDLVMNQSEFNPHIWYLNDVELSDGEFKFRADFAWDVDWGGTTFPSGKSEVGGDNIVTTAGTYDIWFNSLDGRYILIPQSEE